MEMRWHCPPENWWGRLGPATAGSRPTTSSTSSTLALRSASVPTSQMRSGSATMSKTRRRGFSDEIGSWKISCIRRRGVAHLAFAHASARSLALEEHPPAVGVGSWRIARAGRGLAAAGLADEAEGLAREHVEADARDGLDRAPTTDRELDDEVLDAEERGGLVAQVGGAGAGHLARPDLRRRSRAGPRRSRVGSTVPTGNQHL